MRWRPRDNDSRDKICLSFFISDNDMRLDRFLLINQKSQADNYFTYWLAGLLPIFDKGNVYSSLLKQNNWITEELPNCKLADGETSELLKEKSFPFIDGIENKIRQWQIRRFPQKIKSLMNKDSRVVIDDQTLKMHVNDRREFYENNFQTTWKRYVE
jgi:hypothetical protein